MLSAVTQTLATLIANETSLVGTEQIDFDHPAIYRQERPRIGLYCYDLRQSHHSFPAFHQQAYRFAQTRYLQRCAPLPSPCDESLLPEPEPHWFDISFIVSAWDWTEFGEKQLLSEALALLLRHRRLSSEQMVSALRGKGSFEISVSTVPLEDLTALWRALEAPLRPAVYITVTLPMVQPQRAIAHQPTSLVPVS